MRRGGFHGGLHRGPGYPTRAVVPFSKRARSAGTVRSVFEQELAFAHELADRAAEISMSYFLGEFEVRQKPDLSPVTQADLEVETAIREMIAVRYPDDGVIGEEHGIGSGDRVWAAQD